ncbi:MAG TPA: response regulator, partial [Nannocystaceae bacterium]|nr:response regulator [Nannocystaceae bacterium]
IEDNEDSRELLCELLRSFGYDCHGARDGAAGVALVEKIKPAVALVDIGLPGIDGFEVAQRLRKMHGRDQMLVVALTGYGQAADRERALASGFDEHMVKPVQHELLLRLLGTTVPAQA